MGSFAIGGLLPVGLLVIWQLAGELGLISTFFLPTPTMIFAAFGDLFASGDLAYHLGVSLKRAAAGFAIGGSIGLLLGLVAGFSRYGEYVLDPSVQMFRMIPHLAIAPLIILWFGFGEVSKILIIAKGAFFPLYINTFLGIRNVDNKLIDVARVLSFKRYKQFFLLILPASLPQLFLGLRLSLALSWLGLVVAELIGSEAGIGFLMTIAKQNSMMEIIFVGVILFAVVGKLIDSFVRLLERRFLQWQDSYKG
ncbi:ABC transporter permease [Paenibacillus oenotherae]|uniref:ABC transporter permease n=2 Tax=Paenibacillus oenotherae TaxID=1435645 RepID=A0ABS7DCF1_9BACL|nr:ABC transporter permease [Paenibacillus oenotherae]